MTFVHCDIKSCVHSVGGLCRLKDMYIDQLTSECKSGLAYGALMRQRPVVGKEKTGC